MEDTFDKLEDDFITAFNMPIVPDFVKLSLIMFLMKIDLFVGIEKKLLE